MDDERNEIRRQQIIEELRPLLRRVALPSANIDVLGSAPASASTSYFAGYPYMPKGATWPMYKSAPMVFLCQINFAEVGHLTGFPTAGLLQWFIGANQIFGIDGGPGHERWSGFEVRWYDDLSAPSTTSPSAPTPWRLARDDQGLQTPLKFTDARAARFTTGLALPEADEFTFDERTAELVRELASPDERIHRHPDALLYDGWRLHVQGHRSPFRDEFVRETSLGGSAFFCQVDPRGRRSGYPAVGTPEGQVLITIDRDVAEWGGDGIGHLFGDPLAVGRGDLSSVRYFWDCY